MSIDINCTCGSELTISYRRSTGGCAVFEPCENCTDAARKEGYDNGYATAKEDYETFDDEEKSQT